MIFALSSCASDEVFQLVPKPTAVREIHDIKVTYILPANVKDCYGSINGIKLNNYVGGRPTRIERLKLNILPNEIHVERRTDNGISGSGVIYQVKTDITSQGNNNIITFTPKTAKTYQEGAVLPFPVPTLDIGLYLSQANIKYRFEINSQYSTDAIRGNFNRLLIKAARNKYLLMVGTNQLEIAIQIYPYKNGSKSLIDISINTQRSKNDIIDVSRILDKAKRKIHGLVNS